MSNQRPPSELFQERLKAARELRKWSQGDLASQAGMPPSSIAHFESGSRKPSFDTLRRLANALEVTTDYLLGRVDDPSLAEAADPLHREKEDQPLPPEKGHPLYPVGSRSCLPARSPNDGGCRKRVCVSLIQSERSSWAACPPGWPSHPGSTYAVREQPSAALGRVRKAGVGWTCLIRHKKVDLFLRLIIN